MSEQQPGGVGQFMGLVLMAISGLWMAFSGLCAVYLIGSMTTQGVFRQDVLAAAFGVLLLSGLSAGAGYAVFVVGRGLWSKR